jgi:hypothetical protein
VQHSLRWFVGLNIDENAWDASIFSQEPVCSHYSSARSAKLTSSPDEIDQAASCQTYRWCKPPRRGNPTTLAAAERRDRIPVLLERR